MRVQKTTRVYLTVEVEEPTWQTSPHAWANLGRQKQDELKRLLRASGLNDLGTVGYEVEAPVICSFCGYDWEEDEDGPLCCNAAQSEWTAAKSIEKQP